MVKYKTNAGINTGNETTEKATKHTYFGQTKTIRNQTGEEIKTRV